MFKCIFKITIEKKNAVFVCFFFSLNGPPANHGAETIELWWGHTHAQYAYTTMQYDINRHTRTLLRTDKFSDFTQSQGPNLLPSSEHERNMTKASKNLNTRHDLFGRTFIVSRFISPLFLFLPVDALEQCHSCPVNVVFKICPFCECVSEIAS